MKKVTLAIALAVLVVFAGCNKEKENGTTLKASIEQQRGDGNKTSLNPTNGAIYWTSGDKILVYNGSSSATFSLIGGAGSTNGTFTYNGDFEINDDTKAVYPETCIITDNGITFTLPEEQNLAAPGSFANGANPMLGINTGNGFTFVSVCGGLGLSLTGDNVDITAIEIISEGEMLTGTYTGYFNNDNIDVANGSSSVRLNCTTTLTSEAKEFYIVLPVGVLSNGFTLNIYNGTADPIFTKTTTTDLTMELNKVKKMNALTVSIGTPAVLPTVTTAVVTNITSFRATSGGTITDDGGGIISECGVCWSTSMNPTISDNYASGSLENGGFVVDMTGLSDGVTYYVRAYATNEVGTAYGSQRSFKTLEGGSNGWVDLGLPSGALWATCNVGATTPEGYGNFYSWVDNYWNMPANMPTIEQWNELANNTTGAWTNRNGVNGRLFTASNGNTLFLPAAGYGSGNAILERGVSGNYWSQTPYPNNANVYWTFPFTSSGVASGCSYYGMGLSVRQVLTP